MPCLGIEPTFAADDGRGSLRMPVEGCGVQDRVCPGNQVRAEVGRQPAGKTTGRAGALRPGWVARILNA